MKLETTKKRILAVLSLLVLALTPYAILDHTAAKNTGGVDPVSDNGLNIESLVAGSSTSYHLESVDNQIDTGFKVDRNPTAVMTVTRSVYSADRGFRDKAIDAVDREMEARRAQYPDGWLRWQPLLIDQNDVTGGNYLDDKAIAKKFIIQPFPELAYEATLTEYRPRGATASASWIGELNGGNAGTVKITIVANENGADLVIRLRTPSGQFIISPTDVYGAYVSAETNAAFWSTQLASQ